MRPLDVPCCPAHERPLQVLFPDSDGVPQRATMAIMSLMHLGACLML